MADTRYQYSAVDMSEVSGNIDEFIIPENQEACRLLWSKNIFTVMCNNYENENSWITISTLSEENKKLFDELAQEDERFGRTWGGIGFRVPIKPEPGKSTFEAFKELIDLFPMQDVQKDGYMTEEEFLMYYCDCYKIAPNPEYRRMLEPRIEDYENMDKYTEDYFKYLDMIGVPEGIRIFDETKMTKTTKEYIQESKFANFYDEEEGKVFYSKFYYDAHLRYKKENKALELS